MCFWCSWCFFPFVVCIHYVFFFFYNVGCDVLCVFWRFTDSLQQRRWAPPLSLDLVYMRTIYHISLYHSYIFIGTYRYIFEAMRLKEK